MTKGDDPSWARDLNPLMLIETCGDFIGHALPRASSIAEEYVGTLDWHALEDQIPADRTDELELAEAYPSPEELSLMIRAQIAHALENPDDDVTPGIWFCRGAKTENRVVVIACHGGGWETDQVILGTFADEEAAMSELRRAYILDPEDL